MNVLFVTYDFPYPLNSGGKNRAYHLLKYAAASGATIHLLSFIREAFDMESIKKIEEIGIKSVRFYKRRKLKDLSTFGKNIASQDSIFKTLYYDPQFKKLLHDTVQQNDIDIVHFESSYTGFYIGDELRKMGVKQVLGTENIEYLLYDEYLSTTKNIFKKPVISHQNKRLRREEEDMMKRADLSIAVTEDEAAHIRSISKKECRVVENAVDGEELTYKFQKKTFHNLLFVGNFLYIPNIEAIKFFQKEVLPFIDKSITLTIIGKNAQEMVGSNSQIVAKDYVENIQKEYHRADALIFPVTIGGGTNFKILEAMALGVPVIAFPERLAGLRAEAGKEFISAESAQDFIHEIRHITEDKAFAEKIAKNARLLVEKDYTWQKVGKKLAGIWRELNS